MNKLEVVFCCSGWLGEISLRSALKIGHIKIARVMTDKDSGGIIQMAAWNSIPVFIGNPRRKGGGFGSMCDVIASVNYLFVLPGALLKKARSLAFNVHGSLLPKYMGRTPVTWVIINDEVETGLTVHEMVADVDAGPIIYQEKILVSNDETGGGLLLKMARRYPAALHKVFQQVRDGRIRRRPQDLQKKTYFGKREPLDGLIDWRWSARKVYNWVRAQTRPYPGAFADIHGKRYRIWRVGESEVKSTAGVGKVFVKGSDQYVKCGLGSVRLIDVEPLPERAQ